MQLKGIDFVIKTQETNYGFKRRANSFLNRKMPSLIVLALSVTNDGFMQRDSKIVGLEMLDNKLAIITAESEFLLSVSCKVLLNTTSLCMFDVDRGVILSLLP